MNTITNRVAKWLISLGYRHRIRRSRDQGANTLALVGRYDVHRRLYLGGSDVVIIDEVHDWPLWSLTPTDS